ncbi:MAG: lipid-A-disaccharide synthase [Oscillatoriales cyanobacterium]|uniref:Lipid-A-disaccharide synthase n=1 Tax=Microcoleus anatoxicus PTRS2 TaxID=2705321 RepID=A0ABU8YKY0_9CYAN|nr:MAG: lipid-A-disaccharide synthase [Oscillatoriales cyanobacterium]TAD93718.1 MAG: lipid-A-disaccharide synthase [Oscillatoriales cyanobacterium]TAE03317.1 MAG: lipid-A-disaccharide synthase [Oscillatoriales cyanobacterium]TAF06700.1 MAG: lipid-A-disaccharide synthase [Oscillatoriales cyanobacterium]TAF48051.1 MAG: lipid-A-disaccharide synthase [Oscillatoriales cyanobacterium]
MKIFISTGEVSGDLQGALLISAIKRHAATAGLELEIVGLGGQRMAEAGATILADTVAIGSMGLIESVPYIWPTIQVQKKAKQYLKDSPPDVVVLIDYLTPNLGIGSYIRRCLPSLPVLWYIAPQEWVWSISPRNTSLIVNICDRILAIFPEEATYFEKKGAQVSWVGHPLVDRIQAAPSREVARKTLGIPSEQVSVALIPASRSQELKYLMPVIFEAAQIIQAKLPAVHFWIPLSQSAFCSKIEAAIADFGLRATLVENQTLEVLAAADLAIAKSGTVNLELALLDVPQVVLYRVSRITAIIAQYLLKFSIPFMSPPNLVQMKPIVPELLQDEATAENIVFHGLELLQNGDRRQQTLDGYREMREHLGDVGVCDRAAAEIMKYLKLNVAN